jgi:hypothetical protein
LRAAVSRGSPSSSHGITEVITCAAILFTLAYYTLPPRKQQVLGVHAVCVCVCVCVRACVRVCVCVCVQ